MEDLADRLSVRIHHSVPLLERTAREGVGISSEVVKEAFVDNRSVNFYVLLRRARFVIIEVQRILRVLFEKGKDLVRQIVALDRVLEDGEA